MASSNYQNLALSWTPDNQGKRQFYLITLAVMLVALSLAITVASVDVPPKERQSKSDVPERIARFVTEKKQQIVPTPVPTAVPTPRPIPTPRPKVARENPADTPKVLTKDEIQARDKASQSGLLALSSELLDLIDTSDIDESIGVKTKKSSSSAHKIASVGDGLLTAGVGKGSGGVSNSDYVAGVGTTQLSGRELASLKDAMIDDDLIIEASSSSSDDAKGRSQEEVSVVFDQNKGGLYSVYNREQRKNPSLRGTLVLEVTIAPDGTVTEVRIASSQLNDPAFERRIVSRVRGFKFKVKDVEPVTVTFPIEFVPS